MKKIKSKYQLMKANKKDNTIKIRISQEDKDQVRALAHTKHITISNYVRSKILQDGK